MGRQLSDKIEDDVSNVFLRTKHFARTFTYTAPRTGTTSSIVGVWTPDPTPRIDYERGLENVLTGKLMVASDESVTKDGSFSIDSENWFIESVGPIDHGDMCLVLTRQITSHRGNGANIQ